MTIEHPTFGHLTVTDEYPPDQKRSRVCVGADGTRYTVSTRLINKLSGASSPEAIHTDPDAFIAGAGLYLAAMDDGPRRVALARSLWELANSYLTT